MPALKSKSVPLKTETDVVQARQQVRAWATEAKFSLVDQTKLVTAASELARNTIIYGGGGEMRMELLQEGVRMGVRLHFIDRGPGIPDIDKALQDGYTTGSGLGLGLGGAKRLSNEFDIRSKPGEGTTIMIGRWK
ncbi:MAG TPA: anti-sigma regulatory factor [Methylomirabilota bacterium]|nr:anti-sigma regulatory factor [Methylomirabilota bacterium]